MSLSDVRLETPRLILREYEESDWRDILAYAADPDTLRYRLAEPATEAEVREGLAHIRSQRQETPRLRYELAPVRRDTGQVIGWVPLLLTPPALQEAEIGWTLARAHWGQGYATEAAHAVLAFAFETLELHRVWARCQPENTASWRIMEKLGMRREAHFVECQFARGRWVDNYYYALLAREWWQARREGLKIT
jgi:ribosomal-protein-alanine N-acetyltransferase